MKPFENFSTLAHYLKSKNLLPVIQKIIFTLERKTFINNQDSKF